MWSGVSRLVPGVLCLVFLSAACDEPAPTAATSIDAAQLAGTWTLQTIQPAGEAAQPAPAIYTLTLADGRVSTRVDCNTCNGSFSLSGTSLLVAAPLACTRAACPTLAFGDVYLRILSGDHAASLAGDRLILSSARGTLRFVR